MKKILRLIRYKFGRLGPGFITGAADDDPSGIATYSIAGAKFGYRLNYISLFIVPMVISIQEMCGRIGMVSGMGLAGCIKKYYSKKLLFMAIILLFVANTIAIGANLGAMAASLQIIIPIPFLVWLIVITILTIVLEVFIPYDKYSRYLKWMGLILGVYGLTALLVTPNWFKVIFYTVIPHIEITTDYIMTIVALFGTSISPYLFFWQASQEVEEAIKEGKISEFEETPAVVEAEIRHMRKDTIAGMSFSQAIAFFILITSASTLHLYGIYDIETPHQAALSLKPLAGDLAFILFAIGIIGIGLQAVPILAGGVAYAFAESFGFKEGLAKKLTEAKTFYATIAASTIVGALMNIFGVNAIRALYYAAIVNGVIAVPLIYIIIRLASDERIMGEFKSGKWGKIGAWFTFSVMGISSILMIIQLLRA